MESQAVITEEDNESSKITEESASTLVVEESKLSSSVDETLPLTDMTASNFTIQRPKDLFDGKSNLKLSLFLYTKYQETLERAEELSRKPADEEKPFEYKYQARDLLIDLLKNEIHKFENSPEIKDKIQKQSMMNLQKENNQREGSDEEAKSVNKPDQDLVRLTVAKGLIFYFLGINFFESEEYTECEKHLKIALEYMNTLPRDVKICY